MSPIPSHPPVPAQITLASLKYTLTLYRDTVKAFYVGKVKDAKKRTAAIETDQWRYEGLPADIVRGSTDGKAGQGLTLEQLERLVEWKITHGKFRPFLLPQIRKNVPATVSQETRKSRAVLLAATLANSVSNEGTVKEALDAVCVLKGVGPATGTLLLSVFAPRTVPFFQDELYSWLHSGSDSPSPDAIKLKYNTKEYIELLQGVGALISRLGGLDKIQSWEIEKVGFVIGHWELLGQKEKARIWELTEVNDPPAGTEDLLDPDGATSVRDSHENKRKRDVQDHSRQDTKSNVHPAGAEHTHPPVKKKRSSDKTTIRANAPQANSTRQSDRTKQQK